MADPRIEKELRFIIRAVSGVPGMTEAQLGRQMAEIGAAAEAALAALLANSPTGSQP